MQELNKEILIFVSDIDNDIIDEFNTAIAILNEKKRYFMPKIINIKENPGLAKEHNIELTPTLIVKGKRFIGYQNVKDKLLKFGLALADIEKEE
jgi:protein-disulfide isomerase